MTLRHLASVLVLIFSFCAQAAVSPSQELIRFLSPATSAAFGRLLVKYPQVSAQMAGILGESSGSLTRSTPEAIRLRLIQKLNSSGHDVALEARAESLLSTLRAKRVIEDAPLDLRTKENAVSKVSSAPTSTTELFETSRIEYLKKFAQPVADAVTKRANEGDIESKLAAKFSQVVANSPYLVGRSLSGSGCENMGSQALKYYAMSIVAAEGITNPESQVAAMARQIAALVSTPTQKETPEKAKERICALSDPSGPNAEPAKKCGYYGATVGRIACKKRM